MATVKAAVKESLLGTEKEPDLSLQTKASFDLNASQDEATGERFMTEEDFVNAIAPNNENYVSSREPPVDVAALYNFMTLADRFRLCSTKSSGNNMLCSSRSRTEERQEESRCETGGRLRTSSRNQTPNTKLRFAFSTKTAQEPSSMMTSIDYIL